MVQTKKISQDIRKTVVDAHQAENDFKSNSDRWRRIKTIFTPSRSGPATKVTSGARHVKVCKVSVEPWKYF